jgi:hypothetical protein
LPAGVAFGVGGAGVIAGAVTGVLALRKVSDAQKGCTAPGPDGLRHCPMNNQAPAETARKLTTASTATFIVGGVGLAAGVVLAVLRPGGGAPAKAGVVVDVGPGSIGVRGRF